MFLPLIVSPAIISFQRLEGSLSAQRRLLSTDRINQEENIRMKTTLHLFDQFYVFIGCVTPEGNNENMIDVYSIFSSGLVFSNNYRLTSD